MAQAIVQTAAVLLLSFLCGWSGCLITRRKSKAWLICFFLTFPFILFIILMNRTPVLFYQSGLSRLTEGRCTYIMMAACMPFLFGLLIPRLSVRREQIIVGLLTFFGTAYFSLPPFLDPVFVYGQLKNNKTWIEDDICIQSTGYTCGAASVVTALRQFGIEAQESELAFTSHTCRVWGTTQYMLMDAIKTLYKDEGLNCHIKVFENAADMKVYCPVIMIVRYKAMVDHYVTVLEVDEATVLIGDPLAGKDRLTHQEFEKKWRRIGIVVQKHTQTGAI